MLVVAILPTFFAFHSQSTSANSKIKTKIIIKKPANTFKSELYTSIPKHPLSLENINTYKDEKLTEKTGQILAKTQLSITALTGNSFKLSNGSYISANKSQIISDVIQSEQTETTTLYSSKTVNVFYSPFTTYDNQILSTITGNKTLVASQGATTYWGTYYKISFNGGQTGWVSSKDISLENPKLQQVQVLLNKKYNNPNYSIYVKELNSTFTVGVNQNEKMYSASLSKLPILYWTQKRLNNGEATLTDQLLYSSAVNSFSGAYKPAGTGTLPKTADNQNYTLQDIVNRTAKFSDNVGSNMLSFYETNKFDSSFQSAITKIAGTPWNPNTREASSQMVGRVFEALYHEGGASFNALFNTDFDTTKIKAGVPKNIQVAHKIGDADAYNHDAAIVFAPDPYILVVETNGGSDAVIQQISHDVYGVLQ